MSELTPEQLVNATLATYPPAGLLERRRPGAMNNLDLQTNRLVRKSEADANSLKSTAKQWADLIARFGKEAVLKSVDPDKPDGSHVIERLIMDKHLEALMAYHNSLHALKIVDEGYLHTTNEDGHSYQGIDAIHYADLPSVVAQAQV